MIRLVRPYGAVTVACVPSYMTTLSGVVLGVRSEPCPCLQQRSCSRDAETPPLRSKLLVHRRTGDVRAACSTAQKCMRMSAVLQEPSASEQRP